MAGLSRYNISKEGADLYPNGVLKNKLNIRDQEILDRHETALLSDTYYYFFDLLEKGKIIFDLKFIFEIHRYFFGTLYSWAGKIRNVDISKGNTMFCPAIHIEDNLRVLEKTIDENLPKKNDDKREIAKKLSVIHNEFNVIHPFREGNGRVIRLLIDLVAVSIDYEPLSKGKFDKDEYMLACQHGMSANHKPMEEIFYKGLTKL